MSTLKVNSIEPVTLGSENYYLARAWVNFDGTGTVAIRASGNVSSITDNNVGDYTINFASALSSSSYALSGNWGVTTSSIRGSQDGPVLIRASSTTTSAIWLTDGAANPRDGDQVHVHHIV